MKLTYLHHTDIQAQPLDAARRCERCACSLCEEFQGRSAGLHTLLMPCLAGSRVLLKGERWVVIPTIGPLAPGHVMLAPRSHYYSALGCPEDVLIECEELLNECAARLGAIYNRDVLIFEHGATPGQPKVCGSCVEHAHIHVVPGPPSFISAALSGFDGWQSGASLRELSPQVAGSPYLLIGRFPRGGFSVRRCVEPAPSQILRRILAAELGNKVEWDWRRQPNEAVFVKTKNDWRSHDSTAQTGQG